MSKKNKETKELNGPAHPAREGRGDHPERVAVQPHARRDALHDGALGAEGNAFNSRVEAEVLLHGEGVVQRVVLGADPEHAIHLRSSKRI